MVIWSSCGRWPPQPWSERPSGIGVENVRWLEGSQRLSGVFPLHHFFRMVTACDSCDSPNYGRINIQMPWSLVFCLVPLRDPWDVRGGNYTAKWVICSSPRGLFYTSRPSVLEQNGPLSATLNDRKVLHATGNIWWTDPMNLSDAISLKRNSSRQGSPHMSHWPTWNDHFICLLIERG